MAGGERSWLGLLPAACFRQGFRGYWHLQLPVFFARVQGLRLQEWRQDNH